MNILINYLLRQTSNIIHTWKTHKLHRKLIDCCKQFIRNIKSSIKN